MKLIITTTKGLQTFEDANVIEITQAQHGQGFYKIHFNQNTEHLTVNIDSVLLIQIIP